jgi:hypothetical protein
MEKGGHSDDEYQPNNDVDYFASLHGQCRAFFCFAFAGFVRFPVALTGGNSWWARSSNFCAGVRLSVEPSEDGLEAIIELYHKIGSGNGGAV